jgi:hypothetical protein
MPPSPSIRHISDTARWAAYFRALETERPEKGVTTLKFASENGPKIFERCGWQVAEVHSMLKTASRLHRLPFWMRLFGLFPDPPLDRVGSRPWSAVCLLTNAASPL